MDCKEKILSNEYADLIVDFMPPAGSVFPKDVVDYCTLGVDTYFLVYVDRKQISPFSEDLSAYGNTPNLYGLMQSEFDPISLISSGILKMQKPPLSLTGKGVILAFIDTGINYTLDVFKDSNGNSRILSLWDQEDSSGSAPEGFLYGSEYSRKEINIALKDENPYSVIPSKDSIGHGTSIASVAAGSRIDEGNTFLGAAPDSDLVVVKLKQCKSYLREYYLIPEQVPAYEENDIMLGIKYAESFGITFQRPVVICLGIGTNQGNHAGTSPLARYINKIAMKRSRAVVVTGGNEGNTAHHFAGKLEIGNNTMFNYEDVEIRVDSRTKGFVVELWGMIPDVFNVSIRSPGGETVVPTRVPNKIGGEVYTFVYENTKITLNSNLVEQRTGEELIVMRFEAPTEGIWNIRVFPQGEVHHGTFHMWLPIRQFLSGDTYFLKSNPYITLTEPSYAHAVLTVSAYNDLNNSFYQESGKGFSYDYEIKPELAAPGVNVSTIYGPMTGGSLSAAITAGAVAQFLQWAVVEENRVLVENMEIKSYFILGASRMRDIQYPNEEWGFGRLNVAGTFDAIAGVL